MDAGRRGISSKFWIAHGGLGRNKHSRAHLPHNLRVLSDRGEVIIRHPMNDSEELLPQAARTNGRIPLLLHLDEHLIAIGLSPAEMVQGSQAFANRFTLSVHYQFKPFSAVQFRASGKSCSLVWRVYTTICTNILKIS